MTPAYDFVLAPYNDIAATDAIVSVLEPQSLAAIIIKPMQCAGGCLPGRAEFLHHLRKLVTDHGAILILDEVMTSRLGYGGLQSRLQIKPDLTTLGKWIGGGMSFGAFGGRRDIMEMFDPRSGKLVHSGTFNNNVITMAAVIAGCEIFNQDAVEQFNQRGETLRRLTRNVIDQHVPSSAASGERLMSTTGIGSLLNVTFRGPEKQNRHAIFITICCRAAFTLLLEAMLL